MTPIRLGTRGSPLALWQARHVAAKLQPLVQRRPIEIVIVETDGDNDQALPLSEMGGYGVFAKTIQLALLAGRVDVAVHSLKDLPVITTRGISLVATPERGSVHDVLIATKPVHFDELPSGAVIGTSSVRRQAQILRRRRDVQVVPLRGNIDTRLQKLAEEKMDAIVLAEAGVTRLGLMKRITEVLSPEWMLPAVGQGAIGLECREDDLDTRHYLEAINHEPTWHSICAERAMLCALGGGCSVPVGAFSSYQDDTLRLRGIVLSPDGRRAVSATHTGPMATPLAVGEELAAMLINEGASELLKA